MCTVEFLKIEHIVGLYNVFSFVMYCPIIEIHTHQLNYKGLQLINVQCVHEFRLFCFYFSHTSEQRTIIFNLTYNRLNCLNGLAYYCSHCVYPQWIKTIKTNLLTKVGYLCYPCTLYTPWPVKLTSVTFPLFICRIFYSWLLEHRLLFELTTWVHLNCLFKTPA